MLRVFVNQNAISDGFASLEDDEAHHLLNVARLNPDEDLEVLDGRGNRYLARIEDLPNRREKRNPNILHPTDTTQKIKARIIQALPNNEPKSQITLYQGLPKADKMDAIIQKCVEIGIYEIIPVIFSRCVVKPETSGIKAKAQRYNRISREAAKQCARGRIPEVTLPMNWSEALNHIKNQPLLILPWEEAESGDIRDVINEHIHNGKEPLKAGIVIGPEGGITSKEIDEISAINPSVHQITLGPRILRTETAGPVVLTMILTLAGDMGGEQIRA